MTDIAIVADDLSGASDSAVQLARRGLGSVVLLAPARIDEHAGAEVVAVDTESRALPADEAYCRVRAVAGLLRAAGYTRILKKVDSTLRGNLGAEIDAVLDGLGLDLALVAPAFPATGRTTLGGRQRVHGVPVSDTEAAHDPATPVREAHLPTLLAGQSRRRTGLVGIGTVRAGRDASLREIRALRARGVDLVVLDAETDADLRAIAAAGTAAALDALWAGSAGLAGALAEIWGGAESAGGIPAVSPGSGPVLLVAGSRSETTRRQVRRYRARPGVMTVEVAPADLLGGGEAGEHCVRALADALAHGRHAALTLMLGGAPLGAGAAPLLADTLGSAAARAVREARPRGLILTGGDTARAVCRALGVPGLRLLGELEPGVPVSAVLGMDGMHAVTKAGAFGSPDALVRALDALRGEGGDA